MRKNILALTFLAASSASMAAGTGLFAKYDFGRAEGGGVQNELIVGASQQTKIGSFDIGLKRNRFISGDYSNGFELGYANGIRINQFDLQGRVAYGRDNSIDIGGGGFTGNSQYWSAEGEGSMPVTQDVRMFVNARHRNAINSDTPNQNRYGIGADYAISKNLTLRAGVAHYRQKGLNFNGITTAVNYAF